MIRFLVDEDFNNDLVRGLLRRRPGVDLLRVQDIDLRGATDDAVLARAAAEGRVVLTRDVSTLIALPAGAVRPADAWRHCRSRKTSPVGQVIEDLLLVVECSTPDDWTNVVRYIPLR